MFRIWATFGFLLLLTGCGGTHAPSPLTPPSSTPTPQSPNEEIPVDGGLNFASVQAKVLKTHCMECHSTGGRTGGRRIPFDTYEQIMQSDRELVVIGKPEKSLLVTTTELNDADRMPPPTWRAEGLDRASIDLLKEWIRRGAPK